MSYLKVAGINHPSATTGGLAISSGGIVTGGGLDYITSSTFSAASTVSVDGCFGSAYSNYQVSVTFTAVSGSAVNISMRMRASGTDATGASDYKFQIGTNYNTTTTAALTTSSLFTDPIYATTGYADRASTMMDVFGPALPVYTGISGIRRSADASFTYTSVFTGTHLQAVIYDGFSLIPSTGNLTGTVTVYGYRKA